MSIVLSFIAATSVIIAALLIVMPPAPKTLYRSGKPEYDGMLATNMPGFISRAISNTSRWGFSRRVGGSEASISRLLAEADNPWGVSILQYRAIVALAIVTGGLVGGVSLGAAGSLLALVFGLPIISVGAFLFGALMGAFVGGRIPGALLRSAALSHARSAVRDLDVAYDMFAMAMESGYTIQGAVAANYMYLPEGSLRMELGRVIDDTAKGTSFAEATAAMAERIPSEKVAHLGRVLADCHADGRDRSDTLRREARRVREDNVNSIDERANKAEAMSMAALVPVILFLVPLTVMVPMVPLFLGLNQ